MKDQRESCGIVGVALAQGQGNAALPTFYALYALQHRGQESAGIAVSESTSTSAEQGKRKEGNKIKLERGMGFVYEVFDRQRLDSLRRKGNLGIGHVRYSTTGASNVENSEPLLVNYRGGKFAIAHNGNLVNTAELREELKKEGRIFHSETDTEVVAQLLAKELAGQQQAGQQQAGQQRLKK